MNKLLLNALSLSLIFTQVGLAQKSIEETYTYKTLMQEYEKLAKSSESASLKVVGETDSGSPLHVFVVEPKSEEFVTVFINNGIHPGEACGIDASVNVLQDILKKGGLDHVRLVVIPVYNVGGFLNQSCCTRANQNGPLNQGFRGNAQNLDLNRDFIKQDSRNAQSFARAFERYTPHFFIDTHTSNGADYQYTMTVIPTYYKKLSPSSATFLKEELTPYLFQSMKKKGWPMSPYVNVFGNHTPNEGFSGFFDHPRYSTGYAALKGCIGFTTEAHMLKPYPDRVTSTQTFIKQLLKFANKEYEHVLQVFEKSTAELLDSKTAVLRWNADPNNFDVLDFKGYKAEFVPSEIHDSLRLKYNREEPESFEVNFYNNYLPDLEVSIPSAYVIPAGWHNVALMLESHGVEVQAFDVDSTVEVSSYFIEKYETYPNPYEGHYLHYNVEVSVTKSTLAVSKHDYLVFTNQKSKTLIVQTLEPQGKDSYFAWNYFDAILQQKEGFSAYVFEDTAAELLNNDSELREDLEFWRLENPNASSREILQFIYKNSKFAESNFMRYPVYRIE